MTFPRTPERPLRDAVRRLGSALFETADLRGRRMKLYNGVLRLLRVPCGAYGGTAPSGPAKIERPQWCVNVHAHRGDHDFRGGNQPLTAHRAQAQGFFDPEP